MKKILLLFLVALAVAPLGCSRKADTSAEETALNAAITDINSESRISGRYFTEIKRDGGESLYYIEGDIAWDRKEEISELVFSLSQSSFGSFAEAKNYYRGGKVISVYDDEAVADERSAEEYFSKFPFCGLLNYDKSCSSLSVSQNTLGTVYRFIRTDTEKICESAVGSDLYGITGVVKLPQTEKTEYGDTVCTVTVNGLKVVSCRYEFDVKLFDTPAYNPLVSTPESEYTVILHISAKITYVKTGEDVEINEFSGILTEDISEAT